MFQIGRRAVEEAAQLLLGVDVRDKARRWFGEGGGVRVMWRDNRE